MATKEVYPAEAKRLYLPRASAGDKHMLSMEVSTVRKNIESHLSYPLNTTILC